MLKVVSFKICPFVQRVTALLEAKQIPYEIEYIRLQEKPEWFLEMSPHRQVPLVITDSGQALFESEALIEYIEEVYPALNSDRSAEEKAIDRAWSYLASKLYLVQCSAQRSPDKTTLEQRSENLHKAFIKIEKALGNQPFFNSSAIGLVDIAWLPLLHRADIINRCSGYDFLGDYPKMKQWQQSLLATGIAGQSVAEDFDSRFCDFYLSNETYLGQTCAANQNSNNSACVNHSCC
ncbi:glutathione S-transferase family protein [Neptuniibacter sp. QD48_11]|uniref:glutathione S-transferase family protein n=1 Tax=Neptuniibacter sp. QD48_11 TaxID=3398211 RepID=UPI0039F4B2E0